MYAVDSRTVASLSFAFEGAGHKKQRYIPLERSEVYWHPSRVRALATSFPRPWSVEPMEKSCEVPFFDFLNHSSCPNSRWIMDPDGSLKPLPHVDCGPWAFVTRMTPRLLATGKVKTGEEARTAHAVATASFGKGACEPNATSLQGDHFL